MSRSQFKYDRDNLNYNKLDDSLSARVWRVVIYIAAILVIAIVLNVAYSIFFDTPRERQIRRENELLQEQYQALSQRKNRVDTVMSEIERIDRDIYRIIFETEPVSHEGFPGSELAYQNLLQTSSERIVTTVALKSDSMMAWDRYTGSQYDVLMIKCENRSEMLSSIPAIQPIDNPDLTLIASGYGRCTTGWIFQHRWVPRSGPPPMV